MERHNERSGIDSALVPASPRISHGDPFGACSLYVVFIASEFGCMALKPHGCKHFTSAYVFTVSYVVSPFQGYFMAVSAMGFWDNHPQTQRN